MYYPNTDELGELGGINWDAVKDALRKVGTGALTAAKEAAARELIRQASAQPQYREVERQVAAERARMGAEQLTDFARRNGVLIGAAALMFWLATRRRR